MTEIGNGTLVYHASVTICRALTGFVLAALVGIPFAAAMARSVLVRNLFEPIFFIGYPIPKIALFPVFTYIFGIGTPSKIAFTFLECLYPIVVACYFGFRAVQTRLVWSAQNCGASRATILSRVILPAALPSIFSGLRVALPVAIIVVVITEMIGDFHRARLLHHHLEHALHLRQRLRRHHRHRHLRLCGRPRASIRSPPPRALAEGVAAVTGAVVATNDSNIGALMRRREDLRFIQGLLRRRHRPSAHTYRAFLWTPDACTHAFDLDRSRRRCRVDQSAASFDVRFGSWSCKNHAAKARVTRPKAKSPPTRGSWHRETGSAQQPRPGLPQSDGLVP